MTQQTNDINQILTERAKAVSALLPKEVRNSALKALETKGLPANKDEEYKYTQLTKALQKEFDFTQTTHGQLSNEQIKSLLPKLEGNHLVFINGQFQKETSQIISASTQLVVMGISEAASQYTNDINTYLGKEAQSEADGFIAWNSAFVQEGIFIKVPDGKLVEEPIYLHFISTNNDIKPVSYPRNLIVFGKNSQAKVIEHYLSNGDQASFTNTVTEIVVHQDAIAEYFKLQLTENKAYHVGTTQVLQTAKSTFSATTLSLAGKMVRNNLNIVMDAERCESHMYGLYMLNGDTHVDNHTMVDHRKPNCESNETYKGIMDGKSTAVFNGKIFVRQDAQKTNAFQSNRNILISDNASVNTKPQLEIWADDVKCSHGCAVGQMDEEQLFYLRSRGLSRETAQAMLLHAFAADVINKISIEDLKHYLENLINSRLIQE